MQIDLLLRSIQKKHCCPTNLFVYANSEPDAQLRWLNRFHELENNHFISNATVSIFLKQIKMHMATDKLELTQMKTKRYAFGHDFSAICIKKQLIFT